MAYRFELTCPTCGKRTSIVAEQAFPYPRLSCGECLMDRTEVVDLQIVRVKPS
jgi:ribosomal protein S27AE